MEDDRDELRKWFRAYCLYVNRSNSRLEMAEKVGRIEELDQLISGQGKTRLLNRLSDIVAALRWRKATDGRIDPLVIDTAADAIILRKPDFVYPFGAMWFEHHYRRKAQGQGYARLEQTLKDIKSKEQFSQIPNLYTSMLDKFKKDFGTNLVAAIKEADDHYAETITITNKFVTEVAKVFTNFIFDTAISYYAYVIGYTDRAASTTINLRAVNIINSLMNSDDLLPFTPLQYRGLELLTTHALDVGRH